MKRLLPAALLASAALVLSACGETDPTPPTETQAAVETPSGPDVDPTETPDVDPTDTPTNGEFVGIPSGLEVNYDAFDKWDDIVSPIGGGGSLETDRQDHTREPGESKRATCYDFFRTNGLDIYVHNGSGRELDVNGDALNENGGAFLDSMLARQNMTLALAADDTDSRNLQVAYNLVECLTTPDSRSREYFINQIESIRDGSIQLDEATYTPTSIERFVQDDYGYPVITYRAANAAGEETIFRHRFESGTSGSTLFRSRTIGEIGEEDL